MPIVLMALHALMLIVLGLGLFALGHWLLGLLLRPAHLAEELFRKDNPAVGVAAAGYDLGLVLAFGSILMGEPQGWVADLLHVLAYGPAAVALYFVCGLLARHVVVGRMGLIRELTEDRNLGLGFVMAGYLIASGLMVHGLLGGQGGGWLALVVFFALSQLVLLAIGPIYGRIVGYDLQAQLRDDNAAAGLAYGGCLLGMGVVLGRWLSGDFVSWGDSFLGFAIYTAGALVALPIIRMLADLILAPGVRFSQEIAPDPAVQAPNLAAGLMEAVSYVAAGSLVAWSLS